MLVALIVIGSHLRHVLAPRVREDIAPKGKENVLEQVPREAKVGPVVPVFHDIQAVAVEVGFAINIHFSKGLDGDRVPPTPLELVGRVLERHVVLDGAAWHLDLVVEPRAISRRICPDDNQDGKHGDETYRNGGFGPAGHQAR